MVRAASFFEIAGQLHNSSFMTFVIVTTHPNGMKNFYD